MMKTSLLLLTGLVGAAFGDWPAAPNSGGAPCTVDAECGIPAANCVQLREDCASLTGTCESGVCVCKANYFGCPNCHAKSILERSTENVMEFRYHSEHAMLDGTRRTLDECAVPSGGKACGGDHDCGGRGGMCIAGRCACPDAWQCEDCSLTLTDMLYGLECGVAKNGGGSCNSDADCHHGTCEKTGDGRPFCACTALYACDHCQHPVSDLVQGIASCPDARSQE
eukprot:m.180236 g.180236  ORF g.180236 m.180236 type:complete len:225 (-) comp14952_c0_seq1:89-763(-)